MTIIASLGTTDIMERMGTEATRQDAERMQAILQREGIVDTGDLTEDEWLAYCDEAAAG